MNKIETAWQKFITPFKQEYPNRRIMLAIGAGLLLSTAVPAHPAFARDFTGSLIADQYGPMKRGLRSKLTGEPLYVFHDPEMAGQLHDRWVFNLTGERVHLQEELGDLAKKYQNEPSAGYCHAGVNAYLLGERIYALPFDFPGVTPLIKDQLKRIKHADDYQIAMPEEKAIEYLLRGQQTSIYLNEEDETGLNVKVAFEYNPATEEVLISAFGFERRWNPVKKAFAHNLPVYPGVEPQDDYLKRALDERRPRLDRNRSLYTLTQRRVNIIDHLTDLIPL